MIPLSPLTILRIGFRKRGIPTKTVQKIEKGEYVDFRDLLTNNPSMDESPLTELAENGVIVVTQSRQLRHQKKPIQDLATWIEAFIVCSSAKQSIS